ncbi:helix-turn-helix domain-containing protein [Streptomyces kronopolitis]
MAVGVISSCKAEQKIPYRTACRALGVSESWFYKWRDRPPTAREMRRQRLAEEIEEIFRGSGGTYGSPKEATLKRSLTAHGLESGGSAHRSMALGQLQATASRGV